MCLLNLLNPQVAVGSRRLSKITLDPPRRFAQAHELAVTLVMPPLADGVGVGADHELFDDHHESEDLLHTWFVVLSLYSYLNSTLQIGHRPLMHRTVRRSSQLVSGQPHTSRDNRVGVRSIIVETFWHNTEERHQAPIEVAVATPEEWPPL
ncbi:hypothetical protein [Nocardia sp. NPDC051981]|uniref:hypothetical protein n=1 Tax=Nocardia sp. NPDC051981 TaxID=3155417 RepID=UPI003412A58D